MPEITAEQLAARKHHSITVLGERCYIWAVTQAEHDLILAALREYERLNPPPYWTHMEDGGYFYYDSSNRLAALVLSRDGVWQSWIAGKCIATDESLAAAKAAVEKAATSSLVRCDCVDANGNAWPDCTCDHGWRQAAVEKAVRNG